MCCDASTPPDQEPDNELELPTDDAAMPRPAFAPDEKPQDGWFGARTEWTQVIEPSLHWQGLATPPRALTTLCEMYRKPIIRCIRLWPMLSAEAEDLAQEFISKFIVSGLNIRRPGTELTPEEAEASVRVVESFRAWLKGCLFHFLCKEVRKRKTLKSGHSVSHVSLDELGESDAAVVAGEVMDLSLFEVRFDEEYALGIMMAAVEELEKAKCDPPDGLTTATKKSQAQRFKVLKPYLLGKPDYAVICAQLNSSYEAAKTAVSRLREELQAVCASKIRQTVQSVKDAETEKECLTMALSRGIERRRAA
jgi:hypothetical protein